MNYIILDLEWNQSPDGKSHSVPEVPFEIIQIGAVKMDAQFQFQSEFDRFIRPEIYTKLHSKVSEIIGITMSELEEQGSSFEEVAADFLDWCGEDFIFCTWGSTDLIELQRNMKYYGLTYAFPKPFLYYDLQKLYSLCFSDGKTRITLQHAIEELGITEDEGYHLAGSDARYTAKVLKKLDFERVREFYSVDTYHIPSSRKEEIYLNFGSYGKYISRGFSSRESAASDREVRSCKCFICQQNMKRLIKWFSTNSKNYYGLFCCEEHGLIKGRFRIKSTDQEKYYVVRILKQTDEAGADKIRLRQQREREHRKARRRAESGEE